MLSVKHNALARSSAHGNRSASRCSFALHHRRQTFIVIAASSPSSDPDPNSSTNRGFRILERAGGILPQSLLVKSTKTAWRAAWKTMVVELAPQGKKSATGGGSDGNFTAAIAPTLDGLGVDGDGGHTLEERLYISSIEPRMRLMMRLMETLE